MADTITLAIDALASAAFIEGGVSIERTNEAREYTEQRKRELIETIAASHPQAVAAQAAPAAVAVPASWVDSEGEKPNGRDDLERVLDEWNDATGALPRDSGWRCEVLGMLHDAYDLGAHQAAPALPATEDSSAGDLADGDFWPVDKNASRKQLIAQIGQMNFRLTALRQENAGLIKRAKAQAEVQAEPVADCYSDDDGDTWRDLPSDIDFVQGRKLGEEFELQASIRSWPEVFRVTKVPDENDDDYEVEPVSIRTAPQAQPADALTQAALDVLAERRRQVEGEGWTPERDDQYVHGDMASAAGCYAMFTQAYPKGDPHHSWPWDKAWWKPSKDARRNRVKACALLLAEIERLDRAAMAAAQEGGKA